MAKVICDISMSLDGCIEGRKDEDIDRLHGWMYGLESWRAPHGIEGGETNRDAEILDEYFKAAGAFVMGKRMFDVGEKPWGDNPPFHSPVFVITHHARPSLVKEGGTTFHFVTDGVESAVRQAQAAAGDKDVSVAGGADVIQQLLKARLLDEIQIHIAPVLFGEGLRLFDHLGAKPVELEIIRVVESPSVTHLKYRIVK